MESVGKSLKIVKLLLQCLEACLEGVVDFVVGDILVVHCVESCNVTELCLSAVEVGKEVGLVEQDVASCVLCLHVSLNTFEICLEVIKVSTILVVDVLVILSLLGEVFEECLKFLGTCIKLSESCLLCCCIVEGGQLAANT